MTRASKSYNEFARLIRLYSGQILAYISALLLNWNDADDLFQETCLVLWQKFDEFEPGTNFLAWALRVADYNVMMFRRKQSRLKTFNTRLRNAMMSDAAEWTAQEATASLDALFDCMDRLTASDRTTVVQRYCEGVPVRQIAEKLGRSPESIHNTLCRIRKWLLNCIDLKLKQADLPAPIDGDVVEQYEEQS